MNFGLNAQEQDLDELIVLHRENLKNLYASRGAPPSWLQTGNISENYLYNYLNHYDKKAAIIIYSYKNDSIVISLLDQQQRKLNVSHIITQEQLTFEINNVNLFFSSGNIVKKPTLRGAKPTSIAEYKLESSFHNINSLLLPEVFELERYEHLIIVPILNISTLPFSAFSIGDTYLIDKMSYSIAPSLFELKVYEEVNRKDNLGGMVSYEWENALFVGNPLFPKDSIYTFPDLPGTLKEIDAITKELSRTSFTKLIGKDATKSSVTQSICDYDLLYFATHGISSSEKSLDNSFLVLADNPESLPYFTVREIQNIRKDCMLIADLVVLSACQTGLGQSHNGGMIGLARSFQIAGANHVLMSLWNIDDNKTAILMELFFKELSNAKELMPHEALRQAIIQFKLTVDADPKYWAAFSIFGVPY